MSRDPWQKIETAPIGLPVLVYEPSHKNDRRNPGRVVVAEQSRVIAHYWMSRPGKYQLAPTYWQPLPPPPEPA